MSEHIEDQRKQVTQRFTQAYPEVGSLREGVSIGAESGRQFGQIMSSKVASLSRKPNLTPEEQAFIDTALNGGARMVEHLDRQGHRPPHITHVTDVSARNWARLVGGTEEITDYSQVSSMATTIANNPGLLRQSWSVSPESRTLIEDAAMASMDLVGEVFATAPLGVRADDYLYGNMVNLMSHFDRAEASAAENM